MKTIYLALFVLLLAACTTPPIDQSGRKLTLADAGPPPTDVTEAVRSALRYKLKDFETAKIELPLSPRPVVLGKTYGMKVGGAGWEICPMVNAKNSYGAYTGFKPMFILWNNGQVIAFDSSEMAEFWCREEKIDNRLETGARLK